MGYLPDVTLPDDVIFTDVTLPDDVILPDVTLPDDVIFTGCDSCQMMWYLPDVTLPDDVIFTGCDVASYRWYRIFCFNISLVCWSFQIPYMNCVGWTTVNAIIQPRGIFFMVLGGATPGRRTSPPWLTMLAYLNFRNQLAIIYYFDVSKSRIINVRIANFGVMECVLIECGFIFFQIVKQHAVYHYNQMNNLKDQQGRKRNTSSIIIVFVQK